MLSSQTTQPNVTIQARPKSLRRVWLILVLPPLLFLLVIVAASLYFGITVGGNENAIAESVAQSIPYLLLIVQTLLLGLGWLVLRAEQLSLRDIGWCIVARQNAWREILIGAVPGFVLALLYVFVLSPLMIQAQRTFGDYIPPGELVASLGSAALPFFIANVALAPFVEENIYRGYVLLRLRERFNTTVSVIISCMFFGLLHWAGGVWYILLTGVVAGGLFAALRVWRKNMLAPFSAHLVLNGVEFVLVGLAIMR